MLQTTTTKVSEKELSETKISSRPNKEFKIMMIGCLRGSVG